MKRKETGILGEKLAQDYLIKRGFRILENNYRCPHGEIDIVARDNDFLVFIEVRTKTNLEFGSPEESITSVKKERIRATAFHYQQSHDGLSPLWRLDVVAVELNSKGEPLRIELYENAIGDE